MVSPESVRRVAVIGGGLSGLAVAHRLLELCPPLELTLYEAEGRTGGVLRTVRRDGFVMEHGADMFATGEPWAVGLCHRLGMSDQLIETNDAHRRAFVVHRGRLHPVPAGFTLMSPKRVWPVLTTRLLSPWGKLRLGWECFVPRRRDPGDESLADFSTRRLGREAYERLVQPLISGIYTADPHRLSMQAALPQFVEMERSRGSLLRSTLWGVGDAPNTRDSGARYGMFVAPRGGMETLVTALADRLPPSSVRLNDPVGELKCEGGTWQVSSATAGIRHYDAVVVAVPAPAAARLLGGICREASHELAQIPYASAAVVLAGYERDQIAHPLDGFGAVVPLCERRRVLAISFASVKFSGRAPEGSVLLRVFVGGACQAELLEQDDEQLRRMVVGELAELLGARGQPQLCELVRWPNSMPQYHLGHLQRAERIEQLVTAIPRLELAGNAYRGVGIPFCVRSGEQAAERLLGRASL